MSQQLIQACVLITLMLGAAAAIGKASAWIWRMLQKVSRLADDLTGEPARGQDPGRLGVLDRLAAIERTDGQHLAALAALQARLGSIEERLVDQDDIRARLVLLEAAVTGQVEPAAGGTFSPAP